jgi:hypothetical protein
MAANECEKWPSDQEHKEMEQPWRVDRGSTASVAGTFGKESEDNLAALLESRESW